MGRRSRRNVGLLEQLRGGDRRSIGRVPAVVAAAKRKPALLVTLVRGLRSDDPVVRIRAADALEKVTAGHPGRLQPHKRAILALARQAADAEVRWHLAQLLPRLRLTPREANGVRILLEGFLEDSSVIVRVMALQALVDLASARPAWQGGIVQLVWELTLTGPPAVRARGRRLLRALGCPGPAA